MNDTSPLPPTERRKNSLGNSVEVCLKLYFQRLGNEQPADLYRMVINETETALFKTVMEQTGGNQTKAAEYLGITRATLRKKLKQYGLNGDK